MQKITTHITRWFRSVPSVAGFSTAAIWVVVSVALASLLMGCADVGQETLTLKGHTDWVNSVAFSPDGERLASASGLWKHGQVKVWDVTSGQEMLTFKGHTEGGVKSVAFSPDGKRLASASADAVKVWDTTSGQETLTLKGHTDRVVSVAFSPDGNRLASASFDQTVKVWDATRGQETLTLKGHTGYVMSVAFSPDGTRLASAGGDDGDTTVKMWDATSGQETLTLKGHTGGVMSVAFSPDGKRLASASADHTVKVWSLRTRIPKKSTMLYLIVYIGIGIWVFCDARSRQQRNPPVWAIATAIVGPLVVPFYLAKRNLKHGELREGGTAWNIVKYFAMFWTFTMLIAGISAMIGVNDVVDTATTAAEQAGVAIGAGLGMAIIFFLWFAVLAAALVFGLFLKKSTVVETGPTGPLALEKPTLET